MKTILIELSTTVEYNYDKKDVEGSHVELKEPTAKVSHLCGDLEGIIQEAIAKSASMISQEMRDLVKEATESNESKNKDEDEDDPMDGETLLKMVAAGGGTMGKMTILFKDLLKSVGEIGGEKQMTMPIIERLSHKDLRSMMGEYLANFVYL